MIKRIYDRTRAFNRRFGERGLPSRIAGRVNRVILNIFYPSSQKRRSDCGIDENSSVIVSLTSFPDRINYVWKTVASLLDQTVKPKKIILWLADEQFPDRSLPDSLTRLEKRGLEIKFCDDIKPHKKYFYTMREFPDLCVITADDDILYPEDHIERLWKAHLEHPELILCNVSRVIQTDGSGGFLSYTHWVRTNGTGPDMCLLPIGSDGVLYPPHCLHPDVFNIDALREDSLFTDDLWLKCMAARNGRAALNINSGDEVFLYFPVQETQHSGLWDTNVKAGCRNDDAWKKITARYPELIPLFDKKI